MFQDKDVSEFMEVMESLFQRHHMVIFYNKLVYLSDYYQLAITIWLKSLNEYQLGEYNRVVEKLKDQYTAKDKAQKIFNIY